MSSATQDIPDYVVLPLIGSKILHIVIDTCTFTVIYGAFILLFAQTSVTYLKRKDSGRAKLWMFLACTLTFLLATALEATFLVSSGIIIHYTLSGNSGLNLAERISLVNALLINPNIIYLWITNLEVSNVLIIWRAYVLLRDRWWMVAFPLLLLLGSVASLTVTSILSSIGDNSETNTAGSIFGAGLGLSLATNVIATALIGHRYWVHRKMVAELRNNRQTQSERVLVLLVESGVVYCVLQAINFSLGFIPQGDNLGTARSILLTVFTTGYYGFSAMYPTVVVALVNSNKTLDQMYLMKDSLPTISNGAAPDHMTTIRFVHSNAVSSSESMPEQVEKVNET
ncbi:hypothetical protein BDZ94DRAFT_1303192 [Collybia nuda]|uniref:Uncharacterized protein n=1 Tax=Collybia nuda TaxID=64659 RepID=A0A9P6CQY3_9AGAR|nr:hypothetical protein BDZ94DRAFT_1303192 [Collybia nuda]